MNKYHLIEELSHHNFPCTSSERHAGKNKYFIVKKESQGPCTPLLDIVSLGEDGSGLSSRRVKFGFLQLLQNWKWLLIMS